MKKLLTIASAGVLAYGLAATAFAEEIEYSAGQLGGGWYTMSSGIAKLVMDSAPDLTVKVVPGGGTANPSKIQQGKSQLGMGLDIFTFAAKHGKGIYEGKPHDKLVMIGQSFSDNYFHFIRAEGAEYDLETLLTKGKDAKIAVTKSGSSDEMTFRYVMDYFGTSYDDLRKNRGFKINQGNYSEMASQFKDGQVDYVFLTLGIPGAAVIEMSQGRKLEVVPWPEKLANDMAKTYGYTVGALPAGTYDFVDTTPRTIIMATTLMTSLDVSEDTIYKVTKGICENEAKLPSIHQGLAAFHCKDAAKTHAIDLHPGAIKYYKEKGYM